MFGSGALLVDLGEVTATSETLVVFAVVVRVIFSEHDAVLLRLTLPVPHTIVNQTVTGFVSFIIIFRRQVQSLFPQPFRCLDVIVNASSLMPIQHQSHVVVLVFLTGTLPDCNIRRVISCPLTVLDEALLKLAEMFVVRMFVTLRKADIIPHEEDLTVAVAHVGHHLIDLLQYRFLTSERSGFIRHDGMSLVLVFVSDFLVSHVSDFLFGLLLSIVLLILFSLLGKPR